MTITHRQAFELLHAEQPLSAENRRQLDEHLASCVECRADQALYADLQVAAASRPALAAETRPHAELVAAVKGRFRRQHAAQRAMQPLASLGWAAAALLLVAALSWVIGALRPSSPLSPPHPFSPSLRATEALSPLSPPPTPVSNCYGTDLRYIVEDGDTLQSIALHYGVPVVAIKTSNSLQNNTIWAGQVLSIPFCEQVINPVMPGWIVRLALFIHPVKFNDLFQATWDHPWLAGMLPVLPLLLVGLLLSRRRDYPWAEQAWLAVLLFTLGLALALLRITSAMYNTTSPLPFIFAPLGGGALGMLVLHWLSTPTLRTRLMQIVLGLCLLALIVYLALPGWSELARLEQVVWLIAGGLTALIWRAWEGRSWLRFLASGFLALSLLAGACMFLRSEGLFAQDLPEWLKVTVVVFVVFSLSGSALLAGWLAYVRMAKPGAPALRPLLFSLAGIVLICAILFAAFWMIATSAKVGEDTVIIIWLFYFMAATAALVAMLASAWRLDGWRKLAAVLVLACFLAVLIPATQGPQGTPDELTLARAEKVDGAIQRFHARTGRYPSELGELTPWTLLYVPAPVTFHKQVWCYEGGPDFYRLGYYYSPEFYRWPYTMEVRIYASAGLQPTAPWQCEIELEEFRQRGP